jgi:xylulokinase
MHGLVLLDAARRVLRPAILWNDQRTARECERSRSAVGRKELIREVGNVALTGFTAPKILWVRNHEPEVYAKAKLVLLPKDYVRLRLTGEAAMDKADGSGTILFELRARDWSRRVLESLEIPREWMPPTHEGPAVTGKDHGRGRCRDGPHGRHARDGRRRRSRRPALSARAPCGRASSRSRSGTSGVIFATTDAPLVEPEGRLHAFCHAVPGKWHFMGVTLSAAGSLQWYHDTLTPKESFADIVPRPRRRRPAAKGCCSCPTCPASARPTPTRSRAAASSG